MAKSRSLTLLAALVLGGACAWPSPERQLLLDFFQACRVYDRTQLAKLATASCNPKTDGVVQDFDIVSIERREAAWPVREVTITAHVRPLDGQVTERRLVVTLEQMDRRWMVTAWTRPGRGPSAEERPPRGSSPDSRQQSPAEDQQSRKSNGFVTEVNNAGPRGNLQRSKCEVSWKASHMGALRPSSNEACGTSKTISRAAAASAQPERIPDRKGFRDVTPPPASRTSPAASSALQK